MKTRSSTIHVVLPGGIGYDDTLGGLRFQPGEKRTVRARHRGGSFVPLRWPRAGRPTGTSG